MNAKHSLLCIMVPQQIKEELIDALIAIPELSGFNIKPLEGYSRRQQSLSIKEQVQGYENLFQFEILLDPENEQRVQQGISSIVKAGKLKYWQLNVEDAGNY